jgi:NAD(P)-dependent dehydrogenase (short-subunit alcohol dehydrogenase family)
VGDALLRPGLLDGVRIAVAGMPGGEFRDAVSGGCRALGADVRGLDVLDLGEETLATAVQALIAELGGLDALVNDGASLFTAAGGGTDALHACLDRCWAATHAIANGAFIAGGNGGRIVNVAPRPDAGAHAAAACAGLENMARTLSIEWARHAIVTTTLSPGAGTEADALAELVAFLLSRAGGYYSGCLFTLGDASS